MSNLPKNKKLPNKSSGKMAPLKGRPMAFKDKDKPKTPKPPKRDGDRFYGAVGGYRGVDTRKVKRLTNGVIRDEIHDLRGQRRQINDEARAADRRAGIQYQRGAGDLQYVHNETEDYLSGLAQRNQQMFSQQQQQIASSNQALQTMLGDTYSGAAQDLGNELARLGIAETGVGALGQISADQANAQSQAAIQGQGYANTAALAQQNIAASLASLQGMNQGSYMQGMGQNLRTRNDQQLETAKNRRDQLDEVRFAMKDARSERRDLFFQLLEQLQNTGWNQYLQNRQLRRR